MQNTNKPWQKLFFISAAVSVSVFITALICVAFYLCVEHWDAITAASHVAAGPNQTRRDAVAIAGQAVSAAFQSTFGVTASLIGSAASVVLGYASLKTAQAALDVSAQTESRETRQHALEALDRAMAPFFGMAAELTRFNAELDERMQILLAVARVEAARYVVESMGVPHAKKDEQVFGILAAVGFPDELLDEIRHQPLDAGHRHYSMQVDSWLATSEQGTSCVAVCRHLDRVIAEGFGAAAKDPYANWLVNSRGAAAATVSLSSVVGALRQAPTGTSLQSLSVSLMARSLREAAFYCLSTKDKAQGICGEDLMEITDGNRQESDALGYAFLQTFGKGYILRYMLEQRDDAARFDEVVRLLPNESNISAFMAAFTEPNPSLETTSTAFLQSFTGQIDRSFWNAYDTYRQHPVTRLVPEEDQTRERDRYAAFLLSRPADAGNCFDDLISEYQKALTTHMG